MAQELSKTKRRIESISSTLKITKAMELVATAKLKKWKDKMENSILYLNQIQNIISSCLAGIDDDFEIPEFAKYNTKSILYIVITSSLGLCGGYNYNIYRFLNDKITKNDKILTIGTKGLVKYNQSDLEIDSNYVDFLDKFNYSSINNLRKYIIDEYNTGKYKEVKLITTTYKNSLTFIPKEITILPINNIEKGKEELIEPIFEPNKEELFSLLIPKYLNTLLYGKITEAIVCEHASRRNSMDNASDNAEELQEKLLLEFNKARQQAITQEITEVVSGANNT